MDFGPSLLGWDCSASAELPLGLVPAASVVRDWVGWAVECMPEAANNPSMPGGGGAIPDALTPEVVACLAPLLAFVGSSASLQVAYSGELDPESALLVPAAPPLSPSCCWCSALVFLLFLVTCTFQPAVSSPPRAGLFGGLLPPSIEPPPLFPLLRGVGSSSSLEPLVQE